MDVGESSTTLEHERPTPSGGSDSRDRSEKRARHDRSRNAFEPICTVHVTGLPSDTKERDLRNLLIFLYGFEGCTLQQTPEQVYGFARFIDPRSAHTAITYLNGLIFDPNNLDTAIRATMVRTGTGKAKGIPTSWRRSRSHQRKAQSHRAHPN